MSELLDMESLEKGAHLSAEEVLENETGENGVVDADWENCSEEDELGSAGAISYEEWLVRRKIGIENFRRTYDPSVWFGEPFVVDPVTHVVLRDVRNCGDRYDMDEN